MKQITLVISIILCLAWGAKAQNRAESLMQDTTLSKPQIGFVSKSYNFGKIRKGEKIATSFYFKNIGTRPLKILQVQTSCGCTATNWTRGYINPNAVGEITVTFDSGAKDEILGNQSKVMLVISNALDKEVKLILEGEVVNSEVKNN
ncbi:MAG: DUF1573 domain-containing protein [Microscillaceae bacterium]|jgi:hypothetical protein|nr:DUF1573 domain-containing protein [Microscillaceae bacterium]